MHRARRAKRLTRPDARQMACLGARGEPPRKASGGARRVWRVSAFLSAADTRRPAVRGYQPNIVSTLCASAACAAAAARRRPREPWRVCRGVLRGSRRGVPPVLAAAAAAAARLTCPPASPGAPRRSEPAQRSASAGRGAPQRSSRHGREATAARRARPARACSSSLACPSCKSVLSAYAPHAAAAEKPTAKLLRRARHSMAPEGSVDASGVRPARPRGDAPRGQRP
jgi:hypothetical protein